ncbi:MULTISPECIES: hypothetical protein [Corallococcus]|uniref:hypothetical protein n=1 Tax=Corallococcus TaxID=83461 RepID=UPI00117CF02B|nr:MULTISPECIES: hypothetical protein [Corallococcus]NBD10212.1 hypothetical protein [Corallococcus silvisoli]TSC27441.1 hypothetical protein FOF48_18565 [Corallococcus sp. Z5C101001]
MRPTTSRVRASMLLAATLLPFSALADTVHLHLTEVGSEVEATGLAAAKVAEGTRYGLEPLSDRGSVAMAHALLQEASNPEVATAAGGGAVEDAQEAEGLGQDSVGRDREDSRPRRRGGRTNLDLGVALGFNSPSGIFGGELEYRAAPWLGLNLSAGAGAWGWRVGPLARLYPLGEVRTSPFLEGGVSFNLGGETTTEIDGGDVRFTDRLLTPVATVAMGLRQAMGPMYLGLRVGWGFRLREDNWTVRDGGPQDILTRTALNLTQHGGFLTSITLGMSLF